MKKILIIIILLSLTGCTKIVKEDDLGSELSTTTKIEIESIIIDNEQQIEFNDKGKYKRIPLYEKDGIKYEEYEYVTSEREAGRQKFIITDEFIKSVGYGVESSSRTWIEYIDNTSSSTTKIKDPKDLVTEF